MIERFELNQNQLSTDTFSIDSEESGITELNDNDLLSNKRAFEPLGKRNLDKSYDLSNDFNEKYDLKRAFEALGRRSIYYHPSKALKNIDSPYHQRSFQNVNEQKRAFEALGRK